MPPRDRDRTIGIPGGFQVPIPSWSASVFGVVAVVAIPFGVYRYFYPVEPELISVKQANHLLRLEVGEYNKHILETPLVTLEGQNGTLKVSAYEDGCVILSQRFAGSARTRLLVDPTRTDLKATSTSWKLPDLVATLEAQGRCLNPHPGRFQWRYGERDSRDSCWVQVIRTFDDSCWHVQMFNVCSQSWATNRDGSPAVQWFRCIH